MTDRGEHSVPHAYTNGPEPAAPMFPMKSEFEQLMAGLDEVETFLAGNQMAQEHQDENSPLDEVVPVSSPCNHVNLKRQNVGGQHWYRCKCGQKFKVVPWDGKVAVLSDAI